MTTRGSYAILKRTPNPWGVSEADEVILTGLPSRDAITRYLSKHLDALPDIGKQRIIIAHIEEKPTRNRNGKPLRHHTPEDRAKISQAMRVRYSGGLSAEHRRKISESKK